MKPQICEKCGLDKVFCQCGWVGPVEHLNYNEIVYDEKDKEVIREIREPNFQDIIKKINEIITRINED